MKSVQKYLVTDKKLLLILLLAFMLRLIVSNQSLWLDEAIGAMASKSGSYKWLTTEFIKADNHPPLYYLILKAWTSVFGVSEIAIRFPSIIFGTLTVLFVYLIAKKITVSRLYPVIVSLFIATSQFHIYFSQEARMYAFAGLLASISVWSYLSIIGTKTNLRYWVIFSVSLTLLLFSDYVPVFLLPVFWVYPLLKRNNKSWWLKFITAHLLLLVFGIIWFPYFNMQIESGRWLLTEFPGWRNVAGGPTFKQAALVWMKFVFGRISLPRKIYYYVLVFLASIPMFIAGIYGFFRKNEKLSLIILWFFVPLSIAFIFSYWIPAFNYFRFVFTIPAFYLIIAYGVDKVDAKPIRNLLIILILGVNLIGCLIYYTDENQHRENWRDAVALVESKVTDSEIVLFEFSAPFVPYRWYSKKPDLAFGATDSIFANSEDTEIKTRKLLKDKQGVYYFEYLRELSDPENIVRSVILSEHFIEKDIYNINGVGLIYYYSK